MAKVFVSYKYDDCREYVDELQSVLKDEWDHIYKGESDGEDLSGYSDEYIEDKLKDRMFDSTITLVLISKNMKESRAEKHQWIPWEISYSLKEHSRDGRTSYPNGMVAVVVPDENGSYDYFTYSLSCGCINWSQDATFNIIGKNMFNRKEKNIRSCSNHNTHSGEDHSYIHPVRWNNFISQPNYYIDRATNRRENIHEYEITKEIPVS